MSEKYLNHVFIPHPDFQWGEIIDPDQHDANNADMVERVNELVDKANTQTDILDGIDAKANQAVTVSEATVALANTAVQTANAASDVASTAVSVAEGAVSVANLADQKADQAVDTANTADQVATDAQQTVVNAMGSLENAINRAEQAVIDAQSAVGNTQILYDVYHIVVSDNGDGTFTYTDGTTHYTGDITSEGYQRFELQDEYYVGLNRIEATINDTLTRSQASGGLREVGVEQELSNLVDLTFPAGDGTEITFKYYKQLSLGGQHAMMHNIGGSDALIVMGAEEPEEMYAGQLFYKVV